MPIINSVNNHLNNFKPEKINNKNFQKNYFLFKELEIIDLDFKYNKKLILKSINCRIKAGDKFAIVGQSGNGKSTFMNICLSLLVPSKGKILLNKKEIKDIKEEFWNKIGYVPQDSFLIDKTLIENLMINKNYIEVKDIDKAKDLLYEFNLPEDFIEKNIRIGENGSRLSGGQKQKLSIARAIWRNPEILFLDEATSSMDKATQDFVMKLIFKR